MGSTTINNQQTTICLLQLQQLTPLHVTQKVQLSFGAAVGVITLVNDANVILLLLAVLASTVGGAVFHTTACDTCQENWPVMSSSAALVLLLELVHGQQQSKHPAATRLAPRQRQPFGFL